MKTKHIFLSFLATTLMVGCSNEDFVSPSMTEEGELVDATGFALVNADPAGTRMDYTPADGENAPIYKWEVGTDNLGFSRISTANPTYVTTNYKFETAKVSDDNTAELTAWTSTDGGKGAYGYYTTDNATIFKGNYRVYYPYNDKFAEDGEIPVVISDKQMKDQSSEYAHLMANSFMLSNTVADIEGGEVAKSFSMKPFTSTVYFKAGITTLNKDKKYAIKRIVVKSADGSDIFPVEGTIKANADYSEILKSFTATKKVSEMILNVNNDETETAGQIEVADPTETENWEFLSMIPGTYKNVKVILILKEKDGSFWQVEKEIPSMTLTQGRYSNVSFNIDATKMTALSEYLVFNEEDFKAAVTEVNKLEKGNVSIKLMNNVELTEAESLGIALTNATALGDVKVTVAGEGHTLTISEDAAIEALQGDINFDCDVVIKGESSNDNNLLEIKKASKITFKSLTTKNGVTVGTVASEVTINGGTIDGGVTCSITGAKLNLNDVTVKGDTEVSAGTLTANGGMLSVNEENEEAEQTVTVSSTGALSLKGTITVADDKLTITAGSVTVEKDADVTFNNVNATAALNIAMGGKATVNGDFKGATGTVSVNGALVTAGEVTKTASLFTVNNGGSITNAATGKWDMESANPTLTNGKFINNGVVKVASSKKFDGCDAASTGELIYTGYTDYADVTTEAKEAKSKATGFELTAAAIAITADDKALANKTLYFTNTDDATITITAAKTWTVKNLVLTPATDKTISINPKGTKNENAKLTVAGDLTLNNETFVIGNSTKVENDIIISCKNVTFDGTKSVKYADKISYTGAFNILHDATYTNKPSKK